MEEREPSSQMGSLLSDSCCGCAASSDSDFPTLQWTGSWDGSVLSSVAFAVPFFFLNQSNRKELKHRSQGAGPGAPHRSKL